MANLEVRDRGSDQIDGAYDGARIRVEQLGTVIIRAGDRDGRVRQGVVFQKLQHFEKYGPREEPARRFLYALIASTGSTFVARIAGR